MNKQTIIIAALSFCILPKIQINANSDDKVVAQEKIGAPSILVTKLDINDKNLKLCYEIRNDTKHDIWTFDGVGKHDIGAEVFMEEDNQTLLIRSRLDIPAHPDTETHSIDGRYIHLAPGRSLSESVSLPIPVRPCYGFGGWSKDKGLPYATRLTFEIGYYVGDLREIIRSRLVKEKMSDQKKSSAYQYDPNKLTNWFAGKGVLVFNEMNEDLRSRDEEVSIPYTDRLLKGERPLRITVDDLHIPYLKQDDPTIRPELPNLTSCTKVGIQYQPSMLEYFFPYDNQQSLLNPEEIHYLKTERKIILEDREDIEAVISDIRNSTPMQYFVIRERTVANVICYDGSKPLMSFSIYNNVHCLIGHDMHIFEGSEGFQSLKMVTPLINKIHLRVECAANLTNLWNRFKLYYEAEKYRTKVSSDNNEIIYPPPAKWCDDMIPAYKSIGMLDYWLRKPLICPAKSEDNKCNYAMNPNCKYDSASDTVLLFEAKKGWNQHGGPELFTFDNHDPKGGCVLLNDGTVKFIRTEKELQQLRWK
jgi:hypothetical protein